ncbi:MAG: diacylglycerol kinase [Deltaproteobacteria bacterium]|nr:diacylglycerol kinase [Deltaproteobacteria bacterium]MBW2396400.1 diacylglycerol kinase [Deltaproteobacteria bacterium]
MAHRVIQWSTGNVGLFALRAAIRHPELEVVGLVVHSESKEGKDAGTLCGLDPIGVRASRDTDAALALDADCVIYTATADLRPMEAVDDVCRILRSGKNVVTSSLIQLVHPSGFGPEVEKRIAEACRIGGASFFASGIDPGFANDVLPLVLSGLSERWTQIRIREIVNYASYDQPEVVLGTMGFGKPLDETPLLLQPGVLSVAWGGTIRMLAAGLGLELDEISQETEAQAAPRDLETAMGTIEAGTRAAIRFEVQGIVDGVKRLVVEHVTRMHDDVAPDWPQSEGGYHIIIEGVPRLVCKLDMEDEHGDHAVGGVILTATRIVNAVPAVVAAEPRPLAALDVGFVTGRGLMGD